MFYDWVGDVTVRENKEDSEKKKIEEHLCLDQTSQTLLSGFCSQYAL